MTDTPAIPIGGEDGSSPTRFEFSHSVSTPGSSSEVWTKEISLPAHRGINGVISAIDSMQEDVAKFLTKVMEEDSSPNENDAGPSSD